VTDLYAKGLLIVISGPSGVGKGAIGNLLRERNPHLKYSISATTRSPRVGEKNGINYFFLTKDEFLCQREQGEFLEWAEVYGNFYGTPKSEVQRLRSLGEDVILEIDIKGAMQVKSACPDGIFIFILPPSLEELKKRIIKRGSENEESLMRRFSEAEDEIAQAKYYEYHVINDDLMDAVVKIEDIIRCEKTQP